VAKSGEVDIDVLIRHPQGEAFLRETDWVESLGPAELESLYDQFSREFEQFQAQFIARLGPPQFTESTSDLARELYPEAQRLAAWPKGSGFLVLACGQHDHETPIFISFGYRERDA
jgi:hypothetical protein